MRLAAISSVRALVAAIVVILSSPAAFADVVNDAALMAPRPARMLSTYGLFVDAGKQQPSEGLVPYDLQVPLFTDYAQKYRFVYVPAGLAATYDPTEAFYFPVGSVLVKTFAYPADLRAPDEAVRLIETRLLIHEGKGWNAWTYIWNEDQTDAVLKVAGKVVPVSFTNKAGVLQSINYIVPNKNQCKGCHSFNRAVTPIGPKARNLNKNFVYGTGTQNQLDKWHDLGVLADLPVSNNRPSVPPIGDISASLDGRARAYLDVNCAHCHRLEGPGSTSGLFLTYSENNPTAWGYKKRPVAAGRGSGSLMYDIEPGNADASILHYRMASTDPGVMMPEVGRTLIDAEGLELIRNWIKQLE